MALESWFFGGADKIELVSCIGYVNKGKTACEKGLYVIIHVC